MSASIFELVDATGGGCCRLRPDGTVDSVSAGFRTLTGAGEDPSGEPLHALCPELPLLDQLPAGVDADTPVFLQVGHDGVGRELAAARFQHEQEGALVLLVDRSGEARLRRTQARLGRRVEDLEAELAAHERAPRRPRIRSMTSLARRLDEALARARRYRHSVTIVSIRFGEGAPSNDEARKLGETIVGCVRGVDDLGRVDERHYVLVLPHTELAGGQVVAKRVISTLEPFIGAPLALGIAQAGPEERGSAAVQRADQACSQALEGGGGLLLAVALV